MEWAETARLVVRETHIATAAVGLVLFWVPVFAHKGGPLHVWSGRFFLWLGRIAAATALFTCLAGLIWPRYAVLGSGMSPEQLSERVEDIRFLYSLLAVLALLFLWSSRLGMLVLAAQNSPANLRSTETRCWYWLVTVASMALFVYGLSRGVSAGWSGRVWAHLGVGVLGVLSMRDDWRFVIDPDRSPHNWLSKHLECMLGCGIAFHTAFFVVGGRELFGGLSGGWVIVPWVLPSLIGLPAIAIWTSRYQRGLSSSATPKEV